MCDLRKRLSLAINQEEQERNFRSVRIGLNKQINNRIQWRILKQKKCRPDISTLKATMMVLKCCLSQLKQNKKMMLHVKMIWRGKPPASRFLLTAIMQKNVCRIYAPRWPLLSFDKKKNRNLTIQSALKLSCGKCMQARWRWFFWLLIN